MLRRAIKKNIPEKINKKYTKLRGMKDILFDEYKYFDLLVRKATDLAEIYGFQKIKTPILESSNLFNKATGKETDIVSKEMYSFTDKNGDKISLRPEATPGMARAYIEHGMVNMSQPVKMFWLGSLFRHEKPQSGRLREHTQFDLEIFGEKNPMADAQLIIIAYNFFSELQIKVKIQINSIGCLECREEYIKKLIKFYKKRGKRTRLCTDCKKRFTKNTLRLLDCKEKNCQEVKEGAPQIIDFLCDECKNHFIKVLEYLDELDIPYNLNPFLVRGLDYYTKTVFEITPDHDNNEYQNENNHTPKRQLSLGGGGRYDNLIEQMGGRPTSGCGFGIGLERVILKIKEKNIPFKIQDKNIIFLAQLGENAKRKCIVLFEELRKTGYTIKQSLTKCSLKAQLDEANKINAKYCLILGQKELLDGTIILRDMESGIQEMIDFNKIKNELNKKLK